MIAALFRRTLAANAIRVLACGVGLLVWGLVLPLIYSAFGKTLGTFIRDNPLLSQFSQYGGGDLFTGPRPVQAGVRGEELDAAPGVEDVSALIERQQRPP